MFVEEVMTMKGNGMIGSEISNMRLGNDRHFDKARQVIEGWKANVDTVVSFSVRVMQ